MEIPIESLSFPLQTTNRPEQLVSHYSYSIIVPTHNRPDALMRCLSSLSLLDRQQLEIEIIVVDDGSDQSLQTLVNTSELDAQFIIQANYGPAHARNAGAAAAKGSTLIFIDDDCTVDNAYVTKLANAVRQYPSAMIGGPVINQLQDNRLAESTQVLVTFLREVDRSADGSIKFFSSNNLAVPRSEFIKMGGFDERLRLGEDREFCHRWRMGNRPIIYVPDAIVYHWHDLTPRQFWQLHIHYGRGSAAYRAIIKQPDQKRLTIEAWDYYAKLILYPFTRYPRTQASVMSCLLIIAQFATSVGYIKFWLRDRMQLTL